ncbi:hypothetical protein BIU82_04100 [Arthrobacter sp. SW1]|uniref:alpha/beta hydrolase n=1 Tax=Arthrobacter sp. SW1 TaxID=1920889 RepID=UPI000877DDE4|nr:alpha/beta hydrolase [Arthrobacter sp. SW1]OFI38509.1 hypothetical protein BIU82_04100 [Arthrobacter sp. SW1]
MKTDVRFRSNGVTVAAHLYTPDNTSGEQLPAIVVGHPTTGVKEQTAAIYAERLAKEGFITLAFDAAYQGESEGFPRGLEDPDQRADDFRNAVSYLSTRGDVDPGRIGAVGICGSGGYLAYAAQTDRRMKAVATVVGADVPQWIKAAGDEAFEQLIEGAGAARTAEAAGEEVPMLPMVLFEIDESTPPALAEFHDYYRTPRAHHERSTGYIALRSVDKLAQFEPFARVERIAPRPLLMVSGSEALTLPISQDAVSRAGGSAELFVVDGATHVDFYDKEEAVAPAVGKLAGFFTRNLATA